MTLLPVQGGPTVQECSGIVGRRAEPQPVQVAVGAERDADRRVQHRRQDRSVEPLAGLVGELSHHLLEGGGGEPGEQVFAADPGFVQCLGRDRYVAAGEVIGQVDEGVGEVEGVHHALPHRRRVGRAGGDGFRFEGQSVCLGLRDEELPSDLQAFTGYFTTTLTTLERTEPVHHLLGPALLTPPRPVARLPLGAADFRAFGRGLFPHLAR